MEIPMWVFQHNQCFKCCGYMLLLKNGICHSFGCSLQFLSLTIRYSTINVFHPKRYLYTGQKHFTISRFYHHYSNQTPAVHLPGPPLYLCDILHVSTCSVSQHFFSDFLSEQRKSAQPPPPSHVCNAVWFKGSSVLKKWCCSIVVSYL